MRLYFATAEQALEFRDLVKSVLGVEGQVIWSNRLNASSARWSNDDDEIYQLYENWLIKKGK